MLIKFVYSFIGNSHPQCAVCGDEAAKSSLKVSLTVFKSYHKGPLGGSVG